MAGEFKNYSPFIDSISSYQPSRFVVVELF
jgi:hypothetical protein